MVPSAFSHREAGVAVFLHPSGSTQLLHPVIGEFAEISKDWDVGFAEAGWRSISIVEGNGWHFQRGGTEAPKRSHHRRQGIGIAAWQKNMFMDSIMKPMMLVVVVVGGLRSRAVWRSCEGC